MAFSIDQSRRYSTAGRDTDRVTKEASDVPTGDEIASRLSALKERLSRECAGAVSITRDELGGRGIVSTRVEPTKPGALGITWTEMGSHEVIVEAGVGGRWELPRDIEAAEFLERLVAAVADGRATQVFGRMGVRFSADLANGERARSGVSGAGVPRRSIWQRPERRQYSAWL